MLERLRRDSRLLAERFRLPLRSLDAEGPRVKRRYGICYEDGSIRIRLRHARTGKLLKYSALVDTLCHELAHLRQFDHGLRFHTLYRRIVEYARRNGVYRPRPQRPPASQPELFGVGAARARIAAASPERRRGAPEPIQLELFR